MAMLIDPPSVFEPREVVEAWLFNTEEDLAGMPAGEDRDQLKRVWQKLREQFHTYRALVDVNGLDQPLATVRRKTDDCLPSTDGSQGK